VSKRDSPESRRDSARELRLTGLAVEVTLPWTGQGRTDQRWPGGHSKIRRPARFTSGDASVGAFLCHGIAAAWHQYVLRNVVGKLAAHGVRSRPPGLIAAQIVAEALDGLADPLGARVFGSRVTLFLGGEEMDNLPQRCRANFLSDADAARSPNVSLNSCAFGLVCRQDSLRVRVQVRLAGIASSARSTRSPACSSASW